MILFEDVHFSRGNRPVLQGVSFSVAFDERVAVLGASGEGKTTILKLIVGLEEPDRGTILINGEKMRPDDEDQMERLRRTFSVVFQEGALFDSLTVGENVAFPLRERGETDERELQKMVRELLRTVSVEEAIDLMPEELSGGMRRRVAIARAMATRESKMFLYDEPTADLDPVNAAHIRELINGLAAGGRGFIIVTHSVGDALRVAGRFMFLHHGAIILDGGAHELRTSNVSEVKQFVEQGELYCAPATAAVYSNT